MQANRTHTKESDATKPTSSTGADWDPYNVWRNSIQEPLEGALATDVEADEGCSPYEVWKSMIKQ